MSLLLSINCGSSSLKHALFDIREDREQVLSRGEVVGLGSRDADHTEALHVLLDELARKKLLPDAVGHRIVHGGPHLHAPALVDAKILAALHALVPLAPLHLPAEIW